MDHSRNTVRKAGRIALAVVATTAANVAIVGIAIGISAGVLSVGDTEIESLARLGDWAYVWSMVLSPLSLVALVWFAVRHLVCVHRGLTRFMRLSYGLSCGVVAAIFAVFFSGPGGPDLAPIWRIAYLLATVLLPAAAAVLGARVDLSPEQPAQESVQTLTQSAEGATRDLSSQTVLTKRQAEVLELAAKGYTNSEVGRLLSISVATVKTHLLHIYDKLGASDRASAVTLALRAELIDP